MLDAGDMAWVESPGYGGARAALEAAGARVLGVGVDSGGLAIEGRTDRPRLVSVTPSHQYPTGVLMPINRRRELLAFAASVDAGVLEDDYDSEFHYEGKPIAALQGLDESGRVFYVGTFSKSMLADVRVGYAIVPASLVGTFEKAQRHTGQIVSASLQEALSEFIGEGTLAAHIRKMNRVYRGRRDRLVQGLARTAADALEVAPPPGGMQLLARLRAPYDDQDMTARLARAGVTVRPLSCHFVGEVNTHGLFLGFAAWNDGEIDSGARIIGRVILGHPPHAARANKPLPTSKAAASSAYLPR
jgi:GntR family transcriptional regulator/MocR family aminotransferase